MKGQGSGKNTENDRENRMGSPSFAFRLAFSDQGKWEDSGSKLL